jgi:uncharacterized glyoxalase superfamily protein PhnB
MFPYLRVRGAAEAIASYARAFGAREIFRLTEPGGRIGHAEIQIGPAVLTLSDEYPEYGVESPQSLGGAGIAIHLHVDAVDKLMRQAIAAGATVEMQRRFTAM